MANNLEDLLYEIHEMGIFDEVLEVVKEIRNDKFHISTTDLYEKALEIVLKKKVEKNSLELDNDI